MLLLGVSLSRWRGLCPVGGGMSLSGRSPPGYGYERAVRILLKCFLVTARNSSCCKVMFLHLSAILFGGGFWQTPPSSRRPLQRTVRILLECILVFSNSFTLPGQTKGPLLTALHLLVVLGHVVLGLMDTRT